MFLRSRPHHYQFAHCALPEIARGSKIRTLSALIGEDCDNFLREIWDFVGQRVEENERLPPENLHCFHHRLTDHAVFIVSLPPPERMIEAHFTALVFGPFSQIATETMDDVALRYFTLELGITEDGGLSRTVFCEWTDSAHLNKGDGPESNQEAFLTEIRKEIGD